MKKKVFLITAISVLLVSLTWFVFTPILFPSTAAESALAAPYPGFIAPDFSLHTPEGQLLSLSDYKGQPVLVIFWASWCSLCKRTMPGLQAVYEDYTSHGFEILAINTTYQDSYSAAINYFDEQNYTFQFLIDDDGSIAGDYKIHALPTSILVDPEGNILDVIIGSGLSSALLQSQLDQIIANEN